MAGFFRSPFFRAAGLILAPALLAGCTAALAFDPAYPTYIEAPAACGIPPGHLPPPGQCRIWYPDLPPGQQPPPGDCFELERRVPFGACLVDGGA